MVTLNPTEERFPEAVGFAPRDPSCLLMKAVYWWKFSVAESCPNSQRSDSLWRFACGDVLNIKYYFKCDWMRFYVQLIQYADYIRPVLLLLPACKSFLCLLPHQHRITNCVFVERGWVPQSSPGRVLGNPAPRDMIFWSTPCRKEKEQIHPA